MLNVATHLMIENAKDDAQRTTLRQELMGPLRTLGGGSDDPERAPAWWHGDEEAYEMSQYAMMRLPRRR